MPKTLPKTLPKTSGGIVDSSFVGGASMPLSAPVGPRMLDEEPHRASEGEADERALLDDARWPEPMWSSRPRRRWAPGYMDYLVDRLRARYMELEGDFLPGYGNYCDEADLVTARRIAVQLERARR